MGGLCGHPATGMSGVVEPRQAAGSLSRTSWARAVRSASVMKVGAPFSIAKADSTQLLRTVISRP